MSKKNILVLGGHGFIGHHLARRLKQEGHWVRTVDIKEYEYGDYDFCNEHVIADLRDVERVRSVVRLNQEREYSFYPKPFEKLIEFDEIYQMAADMGGAGYVFVGINDTDIIHNSLQINLNVVNCLIDSKYNGKIFYSSSACIYPQEIQDGSRHALYQGLKESDAYPAHPDSEYGWEKLMSERYFLSASRNKNLNVCIARFHNIFGEEGTYKDGREKAPAAMCRKVIEAKIAHDKEGLYPIISIWGDGEQTRSFLHVSDCVDAVLLLMQSEFKEPINIGSEEMVSINQLAQLAIESSELNIEVVHDLSNKALGVRGRNSNNDLIRKVLSWEPKLSLRQGMEKTYNWIKEQMSK